MFFKENVLRDAVKKKNATLNLHVCSPESEFRKVFFI